MWNLIGQEDYYTSHRLESELGMAKLCMTAFILQHLPQQNLGPFPKHVCTCFHIFISHLMHFYLSLLDNFIHFFLHFDGFISLSIDLGELANVFFGWPNCCNGIKYQGRACQKTL